MWVYTDRQPGEEQEYRGRSRSSGGSSGPRCGCYERNTGSGVALIAQNTYFAPVQIAFRVRAIENVSADTPRIGLEVLPARSETELVVVGKAVDNVELRFESDFQFLPGAPGAEHRPEQPYRLPYALSSAVRVSQAYPDTRTHTDPEQPARRRLRDADRHGRVRGARRRRHRGRERLLRERHEHGRRRAAREHRAGAARRRHDGALRPPELEHDPRRAGATRAPRRVPRRLRQHGLQHGAAPALRRAAQRRRQARGRPARVRGRERAPSTS